MRYVGGAALEILRAIALGLLAFALVGLVYRAAGYLLPDADIDMLDIDRPLNNVPARMGIAFAVLAMVVYGLARAVVLWRRRRRGRTPVSGGAGAALRWIAICLAAFCVMSAGSWALTGPLIARLSRETPDGLVIGVYSCRHDEMAFGIGDRNRLYIFGEPSAATFRYDPVRRIVSIESDLSTMPLFAVSTVLRYVPKGEVGSSPEFVGPGIEYAFKDTVVPGVPSPPQARPRIWCPFRLGGEVRRDGDGYLGWVGLVH